MKSSNLEKLTLEKSTLIQQAGNQKEELLAGQSSSLKKTSSRKPKTFNPNKVLALDLASKCGWSFSYRTCIMHPRVPLINACGTVNIGAHTVKRWIILQAEVMKLLISYEPELLVIEKNFMARNVKTTAALNQLLGVVLLLAAQRGVRVEYIDNNVAKKKILGGTRYWDPTLTKYVSVTKEMMFKAISGVICSCAKAPTDFDAADAIALAWAYYDAPVTVSISLARKPIEKKKKVVRTRSR